MMTMNEVVDGWNRQHVGRLGCIVQVGCVVGCQVLLAEDQMLPKFRATVDVSLFTSPSSTVNVSFNALTQKVLVEASTDPAEGPVKTLRQNITLPRFADEKNIDHKINSDGVLEVITVSFRRCRHFRRWIITTDFSEFMECV